MEPFHLIKNTVDSVIVLIFASVAHPKIVHRFHPREARRRTVALQIGPGRIIGSHNTYIGWSPTENWATSAAQTSGESNPSEQNSDPIISTLIGSSSAPRLTFVLRRLPSIPLHLSRLPIGFSSRDEGCSASGPAGSFSSR